MKVASTFSLFFCMSVALYCQSNSASRIVEPRAALSFSKTQNLRLMASRLEPGSLFQPAVSFDPGGLWAYSVAVGDMNADGKPDLVVSNSNCAHISDSCIGILLGNGDGTFQPSVTYDSAGYAATSVATGDVNSDGRLDIVVANACASTSNCSASTVGVLIGNGDGTFQQAVTYDSGGDLASSVQLADLNGDGKPDLVVVNECADSTCTTNGTAAVLIGDGDGTFQKAVAYGSGGYHSLSVQTGDFNGDSKIDLAVANQCVSTNNCVNGTAGVLLGKGDGTFQPAMSYSSGANDAVSVSVDDLNKDGKLDLLLADQNACSGCDGIVAVLLGNGDGTFQQAATYDSGGATAISVAVTDLNEDGNSDLLVASWCDLNNGCATGTLGVLIGNGDGSFQPVQAYGSGGYTALSVAAMDLNADSKPDVLVGNRCDTNASCVTGSVGVLINIGPFATATTLVSSLNPSVFGQTVTFTGNVSSLGFGTPTGVVSFFDGTTSLGTASLNGSGVATLLIATLPVGTHNITAAYGGDLNFSASTSPVVSQVVLGLPSVTLSPIALIFPTQTIFTSSKAQTVTLTNTGASVLTIASINITGQFTETNTCGATVSPGASCAISVTFKPTAKGTLVGSVSITDNASGSPQTVKLTGVGTYVQFTPSNVNFGSQPVGTKSLPKRITFTNKGSVLVNVSSVSIAGANAADFADLTTCGSTVAPGASCFITVTFLPLSRGKRVGAVTVKDDGGGSPQTVSVSGIGT